MRLRVAIGAGELGRREGLGNLDDERANEGH